MHIRMLLCLLLCFGCVLPLTAAERIRIAIGEWSPLIGAELPQYGVVSQLISEAFALEGIDVEYGFFPWKRAYQQVKKGDWHASAIWGRTPEREVDCLFSEVVYTDELVLFYHQDQPVDWDGNLANAKRLQGLSIGLPLGSAKTPVLEEAEKLGWVRYEVSGDEVLNLRKLMAKRIGAVDIVKGTGTYLLQHQFNAEERAPIRHTPTFQRWDYHLIFSKRLEENRRYLELFNQGLAKLKASGRYDELWREFYRGEP